MSITGSVVIYVIIWWIIFFSALPIGIKHDDKNINNMNADVILEDLKKIPQIISNFNF